MRIEKRKKAHHFRRSGKIQSLGFESRKSEIEIQEQYIDRREREREGGFGFCISERERGSFVCVCKYYVFQLGTGIDETTTGLGVLVRDGL